MSPLSRRGVQDSTLAGCLSQLETFARVLEVPPGDSHREPSEQTRLGSHRGERNSPGNPGIDGRDRYIVRTGVCEEPLVALRIIHTRGLRRSRDRDWHDFRPRIEQAVLVRPRRGSQVELPRRVPGRADRFRQRCSSSIADIVQNLGIVDATLGSWWAGDPDSGAPGWVSVRTASFGSNDRRSL